MPALTRLSVRGFRSIRVLEDFELRPLNVLIGANGAGKSNFMDLFRLLAAVADGRLQLFVAENDGPDALLFGDRKRTEAIEAEFHFGARGYRFALSPAGDRLVFAREERFLADRREVFRIPMGAGCFEAMLLPRGGGDLDDFGDIAEATQAIRVHHFHDTGASARVRQEQPLRDNLRLKPDAANLAPVLRVLRERHPDHHRRVVEVVRLAAPFFGDFVHRREMGERIGLEWREASDPDTVRGARQISDGTLRFLCLSVLLLQPAPLQSDPILIDEPELGLHPFALTLLAEMLRSASENRRVIVSTQSADLVNELEPEDIVVVDRRDGASVFTRPDEEELRSWLEDYSLAELWKMNILGGRPA